MQPRRLTPVPPVPKVTRIPLSELQEGDEIMVADGRYERVSTVKRGLDVEVVTEGKCALRAAAGTMVSVRR